MPVSKIVKKRGKLFKGKFFQERILIRVKFIYSEKATNFCEISTVDLSYVVTVNSTVHCSGDFAKFHGLLRIYELYPQELKRTF